MQRSSILCSLSALVLVMTLFGAAVGYAAGSPTVSIVPPPIPVGEGEDLILPITIQDVVDMSSYQFRVHWDSSYLDYASLSVTPPWSPAIIPGPVLDEINGYVTIGAAAMDPMAKFSGSTALATITFHALKSGMTAITFAEPPQIAPPPVTVQTNDATVTIIPMYAWISVAGAVTSYGSEPAQGWIRMFAMKENSLQNWTEGWGIFVVPPVGPRIQIFPPPPVDFTLYFVRVVNISAVKLSYNGADLWISGFFKVANITNPRAVIDFAGLLLGGNVAAGEFSVTGNWASLNLTVHGYEPILGDVTSHVVRLIPEFYGKLPYGDINGDWKIDIKDLAMIAKVYGSSLGDDRYEFYADINPDFKVDIRDLALCAKYYGGQY